MLNKVYSCLYYLILFSDDGSVWDISSSCEEESTSILDVSADDFVLCCKSSYSLPPVLAALYFPAVEKQSFNEITWNCLTKPSPINDGNIISKFIVVDKLTKEGLFEVYCEANTR